MKQNWLERYIRKQTEKYMQKRFGHYAIMTDSIWFGEAVPPVRYNHTYNITKYGHRYRVYYLDGKLIGIRKMS